MDILSYLSELIQTRKAVGVSGLGTVYKKKLPGRYDAATHSFIPPSYTIDFTPEVKEEIILAEFISKKRNVSNDTANYFIDEFSNGILQQLNDHQEADFGDLGKLYKADDELRFEPSEKLNYGFDFYGLPVIKAEQEPSAEEIMPETPSVEESTHSHIDEVIPFETPVVEEHTETPEEEVLPLEIPVVPEHAEEEAISSETHAIVEQTETLEEEVQPFETPVVAEHTEVPQEHIEQAEEQVTIPVAEEPVVAPVQEPAIETVVPDHENFIPDSPIPPRKDEKQLRAEIEALNFYRSKSPVAKTTTPEQEEVIWNIKDNTKTTEPVQFYNKNEEVYTPEEEEPVTKTTPLYLKIILGLLILVIMMIVAYIVKPEWFNGIIANNPFNTAPKTEQPVKQPIQVRYKPDSAATADTAKKSAPVTPVPATAKPIKKDSVIQKTIVKATDTATVYEVMAASMHDQKEADKFIEQMKKSGINAKVVTNMSGRKLKISIATLKDNESAKIELERLTKKLKIPKMYIYKNKQ
jgi:hypothetical protein